MPALPEGRTAAAGGLPGVLQEANQTRSQAGQRSNAAAAYVLDPEDRMIAELKQLSQRPLLQRPEDEQPRAPERTPRLEAAHADQPAGGGPLVGQDLHERSSQAMRRVLEEV